MNESRINNVSDTAFMVATYRAMETERPNALFRDPLAVKVAGQEGVDIVASLPKQAFMGGWTVVIRTPIIDDFIQTALAEGVDTVVNLGAGLDTRPYRMDLPPGLRWIEADYPHVIELKEQRLAGETPRCRLERVKVDLADVDARQKFLNDVAARSKNILILTEGVTPYLPDAVVAELGNELRSQASIRHWIVDYFSPASYEYRRRSGMSRALKNAPFLFEPEDYFGFFKRVGWQAKDVKYFAEEAERLRRPPPLPFLRILLFRLLGLLASAERRQQMKQFAGFVLFEPARVMQNLRNEGAE